jgi:hypothetical protein
MAAIPISGEDDDDRFSSLVSDLEILWLNLQYEAIGNLT